MASQILPGNGGCGHNYQAKSIPGSCQLIPSETILVIAGGWCCLGGKAGDGSTFYRVRRAGKDSPSVQQMVKKELGCQRAAMDQGSYSLMLSVGALEGSPGHSLHPVTFEVGSVLPATFCQVSLVRDKYTQDIQSQ